MATDGESEAIATVSDDRKILGALDILLAELSPDDRLAAVVRYFLEAVESGETPDPLLIEEVAEALKSGALRQKRKRGRPHGARGGESRNNRDYRLAKEVTSAILDGSRRHDAVATVADKNNASLALVEAAYDAHREAAKQSVQTDRVMARYLEKVSRRYRSLLRSSVVNVTLNSSLTKINDALRALQKIQPK